MSSGRVTAPYGAWKSPITADIIAKKSTSISDLVVDQVTNALYYIERRPGEGGRSVIVDASTGKDVFGREWNARTGAHEYGGIATLSFDGVTYFSHFGDGRIYKIHNGSEPSPVTPENKNFRYADFAIHPKQTNLLVAVIEDHTNPAPADIKNSLALINTQNPDAAPELVLSGADFYASPRFSPDGTKIAWLQWNHPDMPWEGSELWVGDITLNTGGSSLKIDGLKIAGEYTKISAGEPAWVTNDTLLFTSDESGYQNPWIAQWNDGSGKPKLHAVLPKPLEEDFTYPLWSFGITRLAVLDSSGSVFFSTYRGGRSVFYTLNVFSGDLQPIETPYVSIDYPIKISSNELIFIGKKPDESSTIVKLTLPAPNGNATYTIVKGDDDDSGISKDFISFPQPISIDDPSTGPLHVVYYPPTNPEYESSGTEKPPAVISAHGGPTGISLQGLSWEKQYFTSRGFAWVDVNYSGSSCYGRAYIERLSGKWGITDVSDCVKSVHHLSSAPYNLIDPSRAVIRGGSAGGYTVLMAMCVSSNVFAAGTSSFGISDLKKLVEFTHKFESKYMDKLIGGSYDEIPEVYKERSPVKLADGIMSPLLILQGSIDAVVPPEQAESIVESIKKRGGQVEYKVYEGEGHGWRQAKNIIDALEREFAFYKKILKL